MSTFVNLSRSLPWPVACSRLAAQKGQECCRRATQEGLYRWPTVGKAPWDFPLFKSSMGLPHLARLSMGLSIQRLSMGLPRLFRPNEPGVPCPEWPGASPRPQRAGERSRGARDCTRGRPAQEIEGASLHFRPLSLTNTVGKARFSPSFSRAFPVLFATSGGQLAPLNATDQTHRAPERLAIKRGPFCVYCVHSVFYLSIRDRHTDTSKRR